MKPRELQLTFEKLPPKYKDILPEIPQAIMAAHSTPPLRDSLLCDGDGDDTIFLKYFIAGG